MTPKVILASPVSYKLDQGTGKPHFTGVEWLQSILAQDYPDMDIYIMANDLLPEMLEALEKGLDERCVLKYIELGNEPDRRGRRGGRKTLYARFVKFRNMVLDHVLETNAEYYISIDSDIIVHPNTVTRLVEHMGDKPEYGMIGAIVNNTCRARRDQTFGQAVYNFGKRHAAGKSCIALKRFVKGSFIEVDYSGACCAMRMSMFREHPEVRWTEHRQGEDLGLCERIQAAGFKIGVDTSLVTLHKMDSDTWKDHVAAFERRELT